MCETQIHKETGAEIRPFGLDGCFAHAGIAPILSGLICLGLLWRSERRGLFFVPVGYLIRWILFFCAPIGRFSLKRAIVFSFPSGSVKRRTYFLFCPVWGNLKAAYHLFAFVRARKSGLIFFFLSQRARSERSGFVFDSLGWFEGGFSVLFTVPF